MFYPDDIGYLIVITGPMFSEKSGTLINQVKKIEKYGMKKVKIYRPINDNRFSCNEVVSRIGYKHKAFNLNLEITTNIIKDIIEDSKKYDVIAFDEVQFFSKNIVSLIRELLYNNKCVIVAGLNMDYKAKEFGYIGGLMTMADEVFVLKAYCSCCGKPAKYTQRLVNREPVKYGPTILIGDTDSYEPRCTKCYIPPK